MQQTIERLLLTIWIGGMWAVGYIVAPTLFNMIDERALAGEIAGRLFTIMSFIGLFSATLLLISLLATGMKPVMRQWRVWLLVVMIAVIVAGEFVLQPQMAAIREGGVLATEKAQFGMLHGIASVLFLINSLAGLVLVLFGLRPKSSSSIFK